MPRIVQCECGKRYEIPSTTQEGSFHCKRCGAVVHVPPAHASQPPGQATPVEGSGMAQAGTPSQTALTVEGPSGPAASSTMGSDTEVPVVLPAGDPGRYEVLREHARGGMGQVNVAQDHYLDREVAYKVLLDSRATSSAGYTRFVREARITGQLEHPGVVPVYGIGTDARGRPFYTMKFVRGKMLAQEIGEYHQHPFPAALRELIRRFEMVCQTVAFAHSRGIIHRDIKPSNIILGDFGETMVLDWGLAKKVPPGTADLAATIQDKAVLGTPQYMSPEQASGDPSSVGLQSDQYSLGTVLYEILAGRTPFVGSSAGEIIQQVRSSDPPQPSQLDSHVPKPLEAICHKAMSRTPQGRYPDVAAMAADIRRWLDDEPVLACPESILARSGRWVRRHQPLATALAVTIVCAVVGVAVATVLVQRERARSAAFAEQAQEAIQQAREKERQAAELAQQAEQYRTEATAATAREASARQAAAQDQARVIQLQEQLKQQTQKADELQKELAGTGEKLKASQARVAAETERAMAAVETARRLEKESADLKEQARDLRTLAMRLSARAEGKTQPGALPGGVEGASRPPYLSEAPAMSFDVSASDGATSVLSNDPKRKSVGARSLRMDTATSGEIRLTYPRNRSANWDLSAKKFLAGSFCAEGAGASFKGGSLAIRLGRGSNYVQYQAQGALLDTAVGNWAHVNIPLSGDPAWVKTEVNHPDLSHVDWLEIHVTGQGGGYSLWLDGVEFVTEPRKPPAAPPRPGEMTLDLGKGVTMRLALIPAGTFTMGSPDSEKDRESNEGPQREVTISKPFHMGAYEVTQEQYEAVMGTNPSTFKGAKNPVEQVSWDDAIAFCKKLSPKTVRLPTEAEWEYACRAGTKTRFSFGDKDTDLAGYGWYDQNSSGTTHPVGEKKPSAFGLYDMHGNVCEWCSNWYTESYTNLPAGQAGAKDRDPAGPDSGNERVLRGGCWNFDPQDCRSAERRKNAPVYRHLTIGFRVVVGGSSPVPASSPSDQGAWISLFDGKSFQGWEQRGAARIDWVIENGFLVGDATRGRSTLQTIEPYDSFELEFEWKVFQANTNSGVFYRMPAAGNPYDGPEYQIEENQQKPKEQTGAVFDVLAPDSPDVRPAGEANLGRIVCRGPRVEHWLNGKKILEYELGGSQWGQAIAASKFINSKTFAAAPAGRIGLQAHIGRIAFRNIRIKPLPKSAPAPGKEKTLDLGKGVTMRPALIPAGTFTMGSPDSEKDRESNEGPQREVTISKPFHMGAYEVTQEQYEAVMGTGSSGSTRPMGGRSWDDAVEFCKKMSDKTGKKVRLPTEAEWEYACRAGTGTRFSFGDDEAELHKYGNYADRSCAAPYQGKKDDGHSDGHDGIAPVGSFKPNAFGLYDMHGNVFEWCADWDTEPSGYPPAGQAGAKMVDPQGPDSGTRRVLRGGCCHRSAADCRSAFRVSFEPAARYTCHGLRVVVAAD